MKTKKYKIEYVVVVEDADADLQTIGNLLTANDEIWRGKTLKPVANGNQLAGLVIDADAEEDLIRIQQIEEGKFGLMGEATRSEDAARAGKVDGGDGIEVANNADGSPEEEEVPQSAYIITAKNENIEKAEFLRYYIASKLRKKYASSIHLYLTRDDVSARHSAAIYPLLYDVENKIRGFLTHFFVPLAGPWWLHQTASKKMQHTIQTRRSVQIDRSWKWSRLLDDHLHFMDFHELGKLITTQSFGMNEPEQILERLEDVTDWESFQNLKKELQSNYSRYFDDSFRENNFHKSWGQLVDIRHRVAHNSLLTEKDVSMANRLVGLVKTILNEAKNNQREELGGADAGGRVDTGGVLRAGVSGPGVSGAEVSGDEILGAEISGAEVDSMGERFVVSKSSDRSDVEGNGVEMDQSTGEVRSGEVNEQVHGQGVAETPSDSPPLMEQDYSDLMPKLNILGKVNIESRGRIQPRRGTAVQGVQEAEGARGELEVQDVQGAKDSQGVHDSQDAHDAQDAQDAKDAQDSQDSVPDYGDRGRDHGGNTRVAEPQSESDEDELPWIIEREEILDALEEFQNDPRYSESRYLAFSTFQKLLVEEGYEKSSIRRLAFEMAAEEDSRVQIYTYHEPHKNFDVTSIKLLDGDLKGEG